MRRAVALQLHSIFALDVVLAAKHAQAQVHLSRSTDQKSSPLRRRVFNADSHWWSAGAWPLMTRLRECLDACEGALVPLLAQCVLHVCEMLHKEV